MAINHYFLELEPPAERLRHAPHVVIVGGGFAGVHACKGLAKADVRITLIDAQLQPVPAPALSGGHRVGLKE
jgi:NADH dehydrogenase